VVERKTVEHFTHIEADFALGVGQSFSYLFEHCIVIDVNLNKRSKLTINIREIAICAVVGTAIRDGDQFIVWAAEDIWA